MKRLIYTCGVLIAVGIGLVISGFILSGKKGFALDYKNKKMLYSEDETVKDTIEFEAFDEAEINIPYASLEIIEGDSYKLEYAADKNNDLKAEVKDGKLILNYSNASRSFNFNFGYWDGERYFKLYVPEGTALKKADIVLGSGSFTMEDIDIADLKIDDDFGSVDIKQMDSEKLDINCESGSVKLSNINTGDLNIVDDFGSVNLEDVKADKSKFDLESGSLKLKGFESSDIEADSDFGSINCDLKGAAEDYNYDLRTEFGSITLDGDNVGKEEDGFDKVYVGGNGDKKKQKKAESGSIKIDFE